MHLSQDHYHKNIIVAVLHVFVYFSLAGDFFALKFGIFKSKVKFYLCTFCFSAFSMHSLHCKIYTYFSYT